MNRLIKNKKVSKRKKVKKLKKTGFVLSNMLEMYDIVMDQIIEDNRILNEKYNTLAEMTNVMLPIFYTLKSKLRHQQKVITALEKELEVKDNALHYWQNIAVKYQKESSSNSDSADRDDFPFTDNIE